MLKTRKNKELVTDIILGLIMGLALLAIMFIFMAYTFDDADAKQIRIAVLDSGYSGDDKNLKICPKGQYDLTDTDMDDRMLHGTNILGIISDNLKDINYCVYILKIYNEKSSDTTLFTHLAAWIYTYYLPDLDIINYSSTGPDDNLPERALIEGLIKKNVKVVVAAGNDNLDLDKNCKAFPACYPGVISVGNLKPDGKRQKMSNYGKFVKQWQMGCDICENHVCMTGSSQAAAVYTTVLAKKLYEESKLHGK